MEQNHGNQLINQKFIFPQPLGQNYKTWYH